jgi:hypothetical protein
LTPWKKGVFARILAQIGELCLVPPRAKEDMQLVVEESKETRAEAQKSKPKAEYWAKVN